MAYFENVLNSMESMGLTDVVLPFLLVFTIVFAIMQKAKVLGNKKNINLMIALVMALFVVIPHTTGNYPEGYDVVEIINESLPSVALLIIAIIMLLLLMGVFGVGAGWAGPATGVVLLGAIIAILWIFGGAVWGWELWNTFVSFFGEEIVTIAVIILVFGVIIAFITGGEGPEKGSSKISGFLEKIGSFFGKQ